VVRIIRISKTNIELSFTKILSLINKKKEKLEIGRVQQLINIIIVEDFVQTEC
jgi:hypothetical protein